MAFRPRTAVSQGQPTEMQDAIENLRRGTLDQFESEWILLNPDQSVSRRHRLGEEVPALVSVDLDDVGDGRNAIGATSDDVTIQSDIESVTITNITVVRQFFRIRAR